MADPKGTRVQTPVLEIRGLNVFYGASHALQGVDLTLPAGTLSVVGRNGMGKTTLCKTIVGLQAPASGSIRFLGQEIAGLDAAAVSRRGIGYVPQGRRLWPSLTVDEHLRLTAGARRGGWTPERVYDTFPRLAERKQNRGNQLSGGEQQMLAISRALLLDPKLLVMDEPTEGLAPVIVAHVEDLLARLAAEGDLSVLIIEQNIGVATSVADRVAIMVNGRVNRTMPSAELAADRALQQRLLGVGRPGDAAEGADGAAGLPDPRAGAPAAVQTGWPGAAQTGPQRIYTSNPVLPNRWSPPVPMARIEAAARTVTPVACPSAAVMAPRASDGPPVVLVAGTFDTKGAELRFLADRLRTAGHRTRLVDLSTRGRPSAVDVPPHQVAAFHRRGAAGVFTGDRAAATAAMGQAFAAWITRQGDAVAGIIGAGGAAGTAGLLPAMAALPVGVPKLIVSTVPAGDMAAQLGGAIGGADILVLPAVTDMGGLNGVSRQVLANAAQAMAGMVAARAAALADARMGRTGRPDLPPLGLAFDAETEALSMALAALLRAEADVIPFKGPAGIAALERLALAGQVSGIIDLSAADLAAHVVLGAGGGEARFAALSRLRLPALIVPGGAGTLGFADAQAVPAALQGRARLPTGAHAVALPLTPAEAAQVGQALAQRLNRVDAPLRLILPEAGLSAHAALNDPAAMAALGDALQQGLTQTTSRRLIRLPLAVADAALPEQLAELWRGLAGRPRRRVMP